MKKRALSCTALLLAILILITSLAGCGRTAGAAALGVDDAQVALLEDLSGKKVGVLTLYRLQSVFEELCQQILLPRFEEPGISFTVEYDEGTGAATAIAYYAGASFDPRDTENTIALSILNNLAESMEYAPMNGEHYSNRVTIRVK